MKTSLGVLEEEVTISLVVQSLRNRKAQGLSLVLARRVCETGSSQQATSKCFKQFLVQDQYLDSIYQLSGIIISLAIFVCFCFCCVVVVFQERVSV